MILYGALVSAFVRKVAVVLEIKQKSYANTMVMPGSNDPEFRKISPLGKIPAIGFDGFSLCDSRIICEYLDEVYPEVPVYPSEPKLRAYARWLEEFGGTKLSEFALGIFIQRFLVPMKGMRKPDEVYIETLITQKLPPLLDYLESKVPAEGFVFGNFMLADISIVSPFINAHYAGYDIDGKRWPKFHAFFDRVTAVPAVSKVLAKEQYLLPKKQASKLEAELEVG